MNMALSQTDQMVLTKIKAQRSCQDNVFDVVPLCNEVRMAMPK
jgi:hypothetical protein